MKHIPFNKPYLTGKELGYMRKAVKTGKISGDGMYTRECQSLLEKNYGFGKVLLTNSCTDAIEMAAMLCNIKEGDEVIAPSFTFVSSVNAFVIRGAKIAFVDSASDNPNMDVNQIESLITDKTKAIVVVHYAGIACDMDAVMSIAKKHNLLIIEDAAQCIDSYYKKKSLGSIGQLGAFSFHESKNIITGEGGMLTVNDKKFIERAEIIWEKGTNRRAFFKGKADKYEWVDVGSSFFPSEITAAFLRAQLDEVDKIQQKRKRLWERYNIQLQELASKKNITLPYIPDYATNNAHMYYMVCNNGNERAKLIDYLNKNGIQAVFHYQSLHKSPFYKNQYKGPALPNSDRYSDCLVRLPLYYDLKFKEVNYICERINSFYKN
jgi:dTDP-4-amino-4,6-dideoxygalactose transaminase